MPQYTRHTPISQILLTGLLTACQAMILFYLAAVSCLLCASCQPVAVTEEETVGVSMCCPEGKILKLEKQNRPDGIPLYADYVAKCVQSSRTANNTLDGATIINDSQQDLVIKKKGVMLPNCPLGLTVQRLKKSGSPIQPNSIYFTYFNKIS